MNRQNAWQLLKKGAGTALVFLKIFPGPDNIGDRRKIRL
jgi:hypothetical protein